MESNRWVNKHQRFNGIENWFHYKVEEWVSRAYSTESKSSFKILNTGETVYYTVKSEKVRIKSILNFSKRLLHSISRKYIENFLRKRRAGSIYQIVALDSGNSRTSGVSLATANRDLCRVKNIFKFAVRWDYLSDNPAPGIPQAKEKMEEAHFLDWKEIAVFLSASESI